MLSFEPTHDPTGHIAMDGLLIVDKPAGVTSHDAVAIVRRVTGERSVGHLGTLDPMATGVLPLLLGRFTRLAQFFASADKTYTGTIRFGFATNTFDAEGEPVSSPQPLACTLAQLRELAQRFHGDLDQVPPVFSAKKINGVPAHRLARAGKDVPVKAARIRVHAFDLTELAEESLAFQLTVSAGGYVRSIAHELGGLAGCGAHLSSLRRTSAGAFTLEGALTLDQLKTMSSAEIEARLPHPRALLPEIPSASVDEQTAGRLRNGMQVNVPEFSSAPMVKVFAGSRDLLAVTRRVAGTLVQPVVVLG